MTQEQVPTIPDEDGGEWSDQEAEEIPVEHGRCVWCKIPQEEWAEDVEAVTVDDGDSTETLCSSCHTDLRLYKRVYSVQVVAHDGFGPEAKRVIGRHFSAMLEEIEEVMGEDGAAMLRPPVDSNAAKGRDLSHARDMSEEERTVARGDGAAYGATEANVEDPGENPHVSEEYRERVAEDGGEETEDGAE